MSVDLHLHTTKSDGSLTPEQVVEAAAKRRINIIAIADHDTTAGIAVAQAVASTHGIEVIPAVEFSSKFNSRDIHILGYFIFHEDPELLTYLKTLKEARAERAQEMVQCLRNIGFNLTFEEVEKAAKGASIGRPHIARVLLRKGYIETFSDAFNKYLRRGGPCFIEKFTYSPKKIIRLIHNVGGAAVFAHPGLSGLDTYIPKLVDMGLDGFEAYHVDHTQEMTKRYIEYAKQYGLIVTGGSDDHGPVSKHGVRMGTVFVPNEVVGSLRRRVQEIRRSF
ncbi:MAG TPA: PHP domain-containing protein [Candidatus Aquicultor sp.]|jgi:hypothetical protein